jgi:UDP-N-acetylmuramoyl-tripeptide--D-alanyl-D-alanine ligase
MSDAMFSLSEAAVALRADRIGPDVTIAHVATDSRTSSPGSLFVALAGEHHDGHDYVDAALQGGAVGALVASSAQPNRWPGASLLVVPDPKRALGTLAGWWRRRHTLRVIAVVGSNGKTTTKEMIASILRAEHGTEHVLATPGNWNNEIGLPLTLLMLTTRHRAAVVELGMNHRGETAILAALAAPTVGLINNAQREHQLFMRTVQDVAEEHGDLIGGLPEDAAVILNADDPFVPYWRGLAGRRRVREFGLTSADITGSRSVDAGGTALEIHLGGNEPLRTTLTVLGQHNVRNALAAVAAAHSIGISDHAIVEGLSSFRTAKGRLEPKRSSSGALLIDDTYNANPDSVCAAIDVLAEIPPRRVLIIGDMDEVGSASPDLHAEIGDYARERGVDRLLALGRATAASASAFGDAAEHFDDLECLMAVAAPLAVKGTAVLVKGSRFMRMERVVDRLSAAAEIR